MVNPASKPIKRRLVGTSRDLVLFSPLYTLRPIRLYLVVVQVTVPVTSLGFPPPTPEIDVVRVYFTKRQAGPRPKEKVMEGDGNLVTIICR